MTWWTCSGRRLALRVVVLGVLAVVVSPLATAWASEPQAGASLAVVTGSAPAAGAELVLLTVPASTWYVVESAYFTLTTSSATATRVVSITVTDGTNLLYRASCTGTPAASTTQAVGIAQGVQPQGFSASGVGVSGCSLPSTLVMGPGDVLATKTAAIQSGDQYSASRAVVESYPNNPVNTSVPVGAPTALPVAVGSPNPLPVHEVSPTPFPSSFGDTSGAAAAQVSDLRSEVDLGFGLVLFVVTVLMVFAWRRGRQ